MYAISATLNNGEKLILELPDGFGDDRDYVLRRGQECMAQDNRIKSVKAVRAGKKAK